MNIYRVFSDAIQMSLTSVKDLTDDELIKCNQVRVVLAFIASTLLLCSVFGVFFSSYKLVFFIVAAVCWVNSGMAVIEVNKRRKEIP